MVKIPSNTPDVYLVGPSGRERPWCGKCHKFLKSETAAHDCTPMHLGGGHRSSSSSGGRKRIRLTPKTRANLEGIFRSAAKEMTLNKSLCSLSRAVGDKAILHAAKKVLRAMKSPKGTASKKYSHLVKRFL